MTIDDALYKEFLSEMEALENFRISYSGLHPDAPLQRDDQDVRRMIEALAMFSARTRESSRRAILRRTMRLFRQHFPYVLNPLPMVTMLRAMPSPRFVDVAEIPKGSRVFVAGEGRPNGPLEGRSLVAHFQTLSPLRVLPYKMEWIEIVKRLGAGFQIMMRITTEFARNDKLGELNVYIDHLNDLVSSTVVAYELKSHLSAIKVVFDQEVREDTTGQECEFYFGAPRLTSGELTVLDHPIQKTRGFLQFPQQDLFMNVTIQDQPRNWRYFTLILEVDANWPAQLRLTAGSFHLNMTPIINIEKVFSDPIVCNGTQERFIVSSSDLKNSFVNQSVLGVYRLDGEGMVPILPGVIESEYACYEIECGGELEKRRTWVYLNIPDSFDSPVPVSIEGLWHQPLLAEEDLKVWQTALGDRHVDGVGWQIHGTVVRAKENRSVSDYEGLMHLLSLKNQRFLNADDLRFLLRVFGVTEDSVFSEIVDAMTHLDFEKKAFVKNASGFKYIYRISLDDLDVGMTGVLDLFAFRLLALLGAWSMEEVVELQVSVRNLELELDYV